jgi:hypothetical protein
MSEDFALDNGIDTKGAAKAVPVQIQCEGFRCLAYRNHNGVWVDYHSGRSIIGSVRVIEYARTGEPACS